MHLIKNFSAVVNGVLKNQKFLFRVSQTKAEE